MKYSKRIKANNFCERKNYICNCTHAQHQYTLHCIHVHTCIYMCNREYRIYCGDSDYLPMVLNDYHKFILSTHLCSTHTCIYMCVQKGSVYAKWLQTCINTLWIELWKGISDKLFKTIIKSAAIKQWLH